MRCSGRIASDALHRRQRVAGLRRGRDHMHVLRLGLFLRVLLPHLMQLRDRNRRTALLGDDLLARGKRHWARRRRMSRDHRAIKGFRHRGRDRPLGWRDRQAGPGRRNVWNRRDGCFRESARLNVQHRRPHRPRVRKHVARHRGERARIIAVGVLARAGIRTACRIAAVIIVDHRLVDVDVADIRHVDVGEVIAAGAIRRHVHVARPQREPADRFAPADPDRDGKT